MLKKFFEKSFEKFFNKFLKKTLPAKLSRLPLTMPSSRFKEGDEVQRITSATRRKSFSSASGPAGSTPSRLAGIDGLVREGVAFLLASQPRSISSSMRA